MRAIKSRVECIRIINESGKLQDFINIYDGRTPEEYFKEYAKNEPDIWLWVLDDLGIKEATE
jgi:hypothetical protein